MLTAVWDKWLTFRFLSGSKLGFLRKGIVKTTFHRSRILWFSGRFEVFFCRPREQFF